jgi:hypothetical protein
MDRRFAAFTLDEFADRLVRFAFSRRIDAVHMHHTWRPQHVHWRGEPSVQAMWRFHTETNGWSDIAQHVTIAPDGTIWEGRDWNARPASASGHNGSDAAGPFMFETVGDFDVDRDALSGPQRAAVVGVIARVQQHFGLGPESLRFHREMTSLKSCPGTSLDLDEIRAEVAAARAALPGLPTRGRRSRGGASGPSRTTPLARPRRGARAVGTEPADAEPAESLMDEAEWRRLVVDAPPRKRRAARAPAKQKRPAARGAAAARRPRRVTGKKRAVKKRAGRRGARAKRRA